MTTLQGTVSVLTATPAIDALANLGIDTAPVLAEAGLSRQAIASLDNRLPYDNARQLWEAAARAANDRDFGVHVAEKLPTGAYDLFDYLLAIASTVGEGLSVISQYSRVLYDRSNIRLVVEPLHARLLRTVEQPAPQRDEFTMALILCRSRQASGTEWSPEQVSFQHEHPGDDRELRRVFGCQVTWGASEIAMQMKPSILELPHHRSDSRLLAILIRYADSLLTSTPGGPDLIASASSVIARQLTRGGPELSSTASALRYPERTLQRRFSEKGVSHSTLVDTVRRGLALKYIGDARLGIAEIAYLLHFGDASSFHRAFKRWTGETPSDYRRRLFEPGPGPLTPGA